MSGHEHAIFFLVSSPVLTTVVISHLAVAVYVLGVQNCGPVIMRFNWAVSLACLQVTETP